MKPVSLEMNDTRYLLPSEVARLVYGYLKQIRCDEIAEKFLNVSPHMKECREMMNKNRTFMTKAHGLTLEEITNQCLTMNAMLLRVVNKKRDSRKQFTDAVEALKYIINPNTIDDAHLHLVDEEQKTFEDTASSGIYSNLNSSPTRLEPFDVHHSPTFGAPWSCSTSERRTAVARRSNRPDTGCENGGNVRPCRNLNENVVFNKSGKVKVVRPRNSFPVAGKTMTRRRQSDSDTNAPVAEDVVRLNFEAVASSPRDDDNLVDDLETVECPAEESSSKTSVAHENVLTMQLRSQSAKILEDSSASSIRTRRNRKKSSGSWNGGDSLSGGKLSTAGKVVPEIEVDPALIQQTLIKNPKLHECIAQNINKAISESPQKKTITDPSDELNNTVKKVTDETMNDPLCKEIINELLGCLTNVNLGLENEAEDTDNSNLNFPGKFYENVDADNVTFPANDQTAADASVPTHESDQNYQNYVSMGSEQQPQTDIILVDDDDVHNENAHLSQTKYVNVDNQRNTNMNSDIRSYLMNTTDIKETADTVETINGTVINILEAQPSPVTTLTTSVIPVHAIDTANQFCIPGNAPLFVGSVVTSNVVNAKKRTSRYVPCAFPTSRVTRRLTPIAPKPNHTSTSTEVQSASNTAKNNHSKARPAKKMKK